MNNILNFNNSRTVGFDICLFLGLTLFNIAFVFIKGYITKEAIVDESDRIYLNTSKFISIIILVPLIEEFVFRGYLCFDKKVFILPFLMASIFIIYSFFDNNKFLFIFVIIFSLLMFFSPVNKLVMDFINTYVFYFIIISSLLFGVIHLTNYDDFKYVNLLVILPKILMGVFLSYITLKYNIFAAYFFHCVNNIIPFFMIRYML
jgi:CAAX amino terminal protease family.